MTILIITSSFAHFSYCPLIRLCKHLVLAALSRCRGVRALTSVYFTVLSSLQTYASEVLLPSPHLCESGIAPCSNTPIASCSSISREQTDLLLNASISAAAPQLHPLQLPLFDCVHFTCCSPIVST